jgi:hypothetical protein
MRARTLLTPALAALLPVLLCAPARAQVKNPVLDSAIQLRGAAWTQIGRIEHSSDKTSNQVYNNFENNWQQAAGLSLTAVGRFSPNWDGAFGLGMGIGHNARGDVSVANNWYAVTNTFVGEARVTWTDTVGDGHRMQVSLGFFPYNYSPENKDLGMYLLRGYVYPGFLLSGFEARHTTGGANLFGGVLRYGRGGFTNDFLVISETDLRPYFDLSLADVVTWQALPSLQVGAGVNLYRVLPRNPPPGKGCDNLYSNYAQVPDIPSTENCFIMDTTGVDTGGVAIVDTVTGGLGGVKAMVRFRFDPKVAFGLKGNGRLTFGKQDLVLYGEGALIGFKDYAKYYDDRTERMPVMLGFNLPAFGWLDKLALEVEYYRSPHHTDYGKSEASSSWIPRPSSINTTRDDWKWALYASRVVAGNLRVSGQVANDHLRTFGAPDLGSTTYAEATTTPRDWYWMLKLTYFF